MQLHGFSDASERAYSAVLYLRMECTDGRIQVSLVSSKTKVAPIKKLTIPRLELCGAQLLARLIHYTRLVLDVPLSHVHLWTNSTIVLSWLVGNPRRFKTCVGNRAADILELTGPGRWRHVNGPENPADCASRGLFPAELVDHGLWWKGPDWLQLPMSQWPNQPHNQYLTVPEEEKQVSLHTLTGDEVPSLIPLDRHSSYSHLKRVLA